MKITKKYIDEVMDFIQDIAYEAGEILLQFQKEKQQLKITNKGIDGLASEADETSELFLLGEIKSRFPGHMILSEEDFSKNKTKSYQAAEEAEFCWVIDPLDGTNNFINGIPIYAVSIALMHQGQTIAGVVYNPFSGECFFAGLNQGAFLIDFRINPLKRFVLVNKVNNKEMHECIFSPAPVYDAGTRFESQLSTFKKNITGARAVRRLGSAALELCYVANGNFDSYWEQNLKPWDVAAGMIICAEAGVTVTDFDGRAISPFQNSIIASSSPLHEKILGKISG